MATKTPKTETLRSVTLDVINNYQRTAKSASASARAGGAKGIAKVDSAVGELLKYNGKVTKKVKSSLETAHKKVSAAADLADKTTGKLGKKVQSALNTTREKAVKATNKADDAVDTLLSHASKKVAGFPGKGTRVSRLMDNNIVASVEPLGIGSAKLLRYVSAKVADGAEKISNKVGGASKSAPAKKAAPAAKKAPVKKAATSKKAAKTAPVKKAASAARRKATGRTKAMTK